MTSAPIPDIVPNWIGGQAQTTATTIDKFNPADGTLLTRVSRSVATDVDAAVKQAKAAQSAWGEMPGVQRGAILHAIAMTLRAERETMAAIVAKETGKAFKEALGETDGAILQGLFMAGEGQRLYGRTTTSGTPNKHAMTIRAPVGIAGLIIAANTPIANVAWKVFPALICGNAAILKAAEDTPATAWYFGDICRRAGLPDGVLNIVQGLGEEVGRALVAHPEVDLISFTGSSKVGREIAQKTGERMARVSLELGGKNPLVVCDDADLDNAVRWTVLSAFSNAGQRCAAAGRVIVFDAVYDAFREKLINATKDLKVGPTDDDDLGPVINARQLDNMTNAVTRAKAGGASVLVGGGRLDGPDHAGGYYMAPTVLENVAPTAEISCTELFGPITILYKVANYAEALALANDSEYGLTASIHTRSIHRSIDFTRRVQAGAVVVNGGTYGSEPHMPFGGYKQSGNGTREPGTEALDVYSELKDIYINIDPEQV